MTTIPLEPADFFNRLWPAFEEAGHKAVILHSWEHLPEGLDSDVDFAVSGLSPLELLRWVFDFSQKHGWRLVQVIEHEPRALYMVCIQEEAPFHAMALDVTWDYRRLGHRLIFSEVLMTGRRKPEGKSFHVPAPGAEFCYILAKSAAKGKCFTEVKERLEELLREDPQDCLTKAGQVFGNPFPLTGEEGDLIENLGTWFRSAACFHRVRAGHHYGWKEILMYLRRMLQPTGVWLAFPGRIARDAQSTRLADVLRPIFRQVERVDRISGTAFCAAWMKTARARGVCEYPGSNVGGFPGRWIIHEQGDDAVKRIIGKLTDRIRSRIGA
jgi:hypothetical protein